MTGPPRFSVIIPTYGRPAYLRDAVQSVLAQTIDDFEVVIVDDASPEPADVDLDDSRIRYVRSPSNLGPGGARNLGVSEARGEILTFLDDDDLWLPRRLQIAEAAIDDAPIILCWQYSTGGRLLNGCVHDEILDATPPQLGAIALRKSAWVPMDSSYRRGQDVIWWLDVAHQTPVLTVPEQGLIIRDRPDKQSARELERRIDASHRILHERRDYFSSHPRAAAYRWQKIGVWEHRRGRHWCAHKAFLRSLMSRFDINVAKMAIRTIVR